MAIHAQTVFAVVRMSPTGVQPLGTAFTVGPRLLATAFHVTSGVDQGLHIINPVVPGADHYQDTTQTNVSLLSVTIEGVDPVRDLALLKLGDNVTAPHFNSLSSTDAVEVGQEVTVLGFPHADTGRVVLTQRKTNVGARILIGNRGVKSKYAVVNLQGRPGQSGSPVLDSSGAVTSVVVGGYAPGGGGGVIIAGIDPTTLHETTHAVSAEYVKGMME